jgi:hypothetical protein
MKHQPQSVSESLPAQSATEPQTRQKPLSKPAWWALFLLATYTMSLWFQTFKAFTRLPNLLHGLAWLSVMAALVALLALLAYDSYVQEKARGRIQKSVRLFEWLMKHRFLLPPSSCLATNRLQTASQPLSSELQSGQSANRQQAEQEKDMTP